MLTFRRLCVLLLLLTAPLQANDDIAPQKRQLIDQLLEESGQSATAVGEQFSSFFIQQMSAVLRQAHPDLDQRAFDILKEEVALVIQEEMHVSGKFVELIYPIYDRYFTVEDLEAMLEFYRTDLGQKVLAVMPIISREAMLVGRQFGEALAPKIERRIVDRLQREGYR